MREGNPRSNVPHLVLVDDDASVRASLQGLLEAIGYDVATFESAKDFLASRITHTARCLVLDVQMPHMTGPELQRRLTAVGNPIPIVFITPHNDAKLRAALIAAGAVDCLFKPFNEETLIEALDTALAKNP